MFCYHPSLCCKWNSQNNLASNNWINDSTNNIINSSNISTVLFFRPISSIPSFPSRIGGDCAATPVRILYPEPPSGLDICSSEEDQFGGFLKWWYSTTMSFPTKNDHFGCFEGNTPFSVWEKWCALNPYSTHGSTTLWFGRTVRYTVCHSCWSTCFRKCWEIYDSMWGSLV